MKKVLPATLAGLPKPAGNLGEKPGGSNTIEYAVIEGQCQIDRAVRPPRHGGAHEQNRRGR